MRDLQAFGNWFMSYLRLFRCHQQLWMMRSPTAICGFGVDRARAETLLAHQPSVRPPLHSPSRALCTILSSLPRVLVKHLPQSGWGFVLPMGLNSFAMRIVMAAHCGFPS